MLLLAGIAFFFVAHQLIRLHGPDSTLARAFGRDVKGYISPVLYVAGIGLAFVSPYLALAIYAAVAAIWFIPTAGSSGCSAARRPRPACRDPIWQISTRFRPACLAA